MLLTPRSALWISPADKDIMGSSASGSSKLGLEVESVATLRILIVEDSVASAERLATLLRSDGYNVEIARDGFTAVARELAFRPDVVLLDPGLPGMHGYDMAKQMASQRTDRRPLFIALTGSGKEQDSRLSAEAGIDLHLTKPVDPEQVRCILARFQEVIGP
jgi:two-component system, OmpR family, response regulator